MQKQKHIKCERAKIENKTPRHQLDSCLRYYHSGPGRENQIARLAARTPEQIQKKKDGTKRWKDRNKVRVTLLRFATNCKVRAVKKNPSLANVSAWDLIGCDVAELQAHLEMMFRPGISWENRSEWQIDHIRPLCEFDLTKEARVYECLHYTNIQILATGAHDVKQRQESADCMERLAREYWSKHETADYPGFVPAWGALTRHRAAKNRIADSLKASQDARLA